MTEPNDGTEPPPGILAGIKVVEFAQNAAVPHCGRLMAGMGADVVKVEPPNGDAMRGGIKLAPGEAKTFAVINPSKRGIVLDLSIDGARDVVDRLFAWADVALVGFKQSDLARYGIDWDHARAVNPRLVHLTHTPFGPDGPDADVGGYDTLVQGRSGAGFVMNRTENGTPVSSRPAVNDFGTGMLSALGVVAALRHRDLTGEGQRVDASLLGTAMSLATPVVHSFAETDLDDAAAVRAELQQARDAGVGFEEQRQMYEARMMSGNGSFRVYFRHYLTADGVISVAGLTRKLWAKFHEVTGLPFADVRRPDAPEFIRLAEDAEALFRTRTTAAWIADLRAVGYPCGPYHLPIDALDDEQVRANGFAVDIDHPAFGTYTTSGMPIRFSAAPNVPYRASPGLGQHTREVMSELGFSDGEADELAADGVLGEVPGD
jgi:crotonobetainyl-CoA:carnitine CoA-transferase CaiB-like acyl-CoA transferase